MQLQLNQMIEVLRQAYGWDATCYDASFLAKSLTQRLAATSVASVPAYLQRLSEDKAEAEVFLRSLNITYSEFFRNPLTFALLEQLILPGLAEAKGTPRPTELRVWSAGCAAGQEAWSVAMLLEDLAATRQRPIPFRVLGSDISDAALALAREGVYDQTAVQNIRLKHFRAYFSAQGNAWAVAPQLRDRVEFCAYDMLDEHSVCPPASLYGDFDLILCCNFLFYYRPEIRQLILSKVCRALGPRGYLVTGEAERDFVAQHEELRPVAPPSAIFQKR
ncbi:MAG: CheR family methyltransferase [Verrucomicrobiota bacterium]